MTVADLERRLAGRTPEPMEVTGRYAVLVPLVERSGELSLLYEVRASSLRRQPGEACFPGGRVEPGESPLDCALRETREELGIPPERIRVIAPLDFLHHRSGFVMYPFLAQVAEETAIVPSPAEVERTFLVPLSWLREHSPVEYRYDLLPAPPADFPYHLAGIPESYAWQKGVESCPIYPWPERAVWGLTARITRRLMELVEEG